VSFGSASHILRSRELTPKRELRLGKPREGGLSLSAKDRDEGVIRRRGSLSIVSVQVGAERPTRLRRLRQVGFGGNPTFAGFTIHHSPFTIHHSPFTIHHSAFGIRHSAFGIRHSAFGIRH
jgi:hypothetical protein